MDAKDLDPEILAFAFSIQNKLNAAKNIDVKDSILNTPIDKIDDNIINEVCLNYNHSFGLMTYPERRSLMFEAKEWLHAWQKIK